MSEDGRIIVSGGWDAEARIWRVGHWEAATVLSAHEGSVWDVLAYDKDTVITGMEDSPLIRCFSFTELTIPLYCSLRRQENSSLEPFWQAFTHDSGELGRCKGSLQTPSRSL